jgi:membrane protease YdiL (CAAX protease family)
MLAMYVVGSSAFIVLVVALEQTRPLRTLLGRSVIAENAFFFAAQLLVLVGGFLFGIARLRPSDVGLIARKLPQGIVVTILTWIAIQTSAAIFGYAMGTPPALAPHWTSGRAGPTLLWAVVMLLGAGLFEETVNRAFLYPQLYLRLRGSHRIRIAAALLASQCIFALQHIPAHVFVRHLSAREMTVTVLAQGLVGAMLALLYLRTRNLWISIGFHGLANAPTFLFTESMGWENMLVLLVIAWPWLVRNPRHRGFAAIDTSTREVEPLLQILPEPATALHPSSVAQHE